RRALALHSGLTSHHPLDPQFQVRHLSRLDAGRDGRRQLAEAQPEQLEEHVLCFLAPPLAPPLSHLLLEPAHHHLLDLAAHSTSPANAVAARAWRSSSDCRPRSSSTSARRGTCSPRAASRSSSASSSSSKRTAAVQPLRP